MPETVYLLEQGGRVEKLDDETAARFGRIDGEIDPATLLPEELQFDQLLIVFNGVADGRGFSLVKAIREHPDFQGQLYAGGFINPDQLSLAFQTGFDGVVVSQDRWDEYGSEHWHQALEPLVSLSYATTQSSAIRSIWQQRHSA